MLKHALQPWASLRSYGIWMRTSGTSSEPAVIVCPKQRTRARLLHRPYHRRGTARTAALAALPQRAHAIAYVDGEAVHYAHTRAIVMTLEGVRSPCCALRRAAALLIDPRRSSAPNGFGCGWAAGAGAAQSYARAIRRRGTGACARPSRCGAVQCTPTYQRVAAVTRAGGRGIGCITAEGTRVQRRLQR